MGIVTTEGSSTSSIGYTMLFACKTRRLQAMQAPTFDVSCCGMMALKALKAVGCAVKHKS